MIHLSQITGFRLRPFQVPVIVQENQCIMIHMPHFMEVPKAGVSVYIVHISILLFFFQGKYMKSSHLKAVP